MTYDVALDLLQTWAVRSAVVLLVAAILTLLMRRSSAAARHWVWTLAVVLTVLVPAGSVAVPAWRLAVLPPPARVSSSTPADIRLRPVDDVRPTVLEPSVVVRGVTPSEVAAPITSSVAARPPLPRSAVILLVWFCGVILIALRWAFGGVIAWVRLGRSPVVSMGPVYDRLQQLRREIRISRMVRLHAGRAGDSPLTWGTVRPHVSVPSDWPIERLDAALLHELSHVRRFDCATQWLARGCTAIYWFNPLAWLAASRMRIERERACDDAVLRHGADPAGYAGLLVSVAAACRNRWASMAVAPMARRSGLGRRVESILDPTTDHRPAGRRWAALVSIAALIVSVPVVAVRLIPRAAVAEQPTTRPALDTVDVTVVDEAGRPIAGADAMIWDGGPKGNWVKTDVGGHLYPSTKQGYCSIWVKHAGYATKLAGLSATKEPIPAAYTLRMTAGVRIGGRVVDDAGRPIAGAHVQVSIHKHVNTQEEYNSDTTLETGADGRWSFGDAPDVADGISVRGWDGRYASNGFPDADKDTIAQFRAEQATCVLHDGVPVDGVVVGPDGKPLAGATVQAGPFHALGQMPPTTTAADGRFRHIASKTGELVLTITAPGCAPEFRKFFGVEKPISLTVPLVKSTPLIGTVVDTDGKPLPKAFVSVDEWRHSRALQMQVRTDDQGKFVWPDPPTDEAFYNVDGPDDQFIGRRRVPITATGEPAVIRLNRRPHVVGTVVDTETGKPIERLRLAVGQLQQYGPVFASGEGDGDLADYRGGTFDVPALSDEPRFTLRVTADGYLPFDSPPISVDTPLTTLAIKLQRAADITVKARSADDKPVAGATGVLVPPGKEWVIYNGGIEFDPLRRHKPFESDDAGLLRFPPRATDYMIGVVSPAGYGVATRKQLAQLDDTITLTPWGRVRGVARIGDRPAANQQITIVPLDYQFSMVRKEPSIGFKAEVTTDADGKFDLDRVPAGRVMLYRNITWPLPGGKMSGWCRTQVQTLDMSPGQTIDLTVGGRGRAVVGRLTLPPELAGRTDLFFSASYLFDSSVRVNWAQPPVGRGAKIFGMEIDADGHFRVEDVPAGSYRMEIFCLEREPHPDRNPNNFPVAMGRGKVVVPPMDGERDPNPLEVPDVEMTVYSSK